MTIEELTEEQLEQRDTQIEVFHNTIVDIITKALTDAKLQFKPIPVTYPATDDTEFIITSPTEYPVYITIYTGETKETQISPEA